MNYLLDTNHWSQLQRGHPAVVSRVRALPPDSTIYMPVVAQAELLAGVESLPESARKKQLRELYEHTLTVAADVLPINSPVAERFATVFAQLRKDGRPIETNDIWIAAIALAQDLTVVSNDAHLRFVHGLSVEDWTAEANA